MRLAVINEGPLRLTETFIRAHASRLPGQVYLIHDHPPHVGKEGRFKPPLPVYAFRGLAHRTGLLNHSEYLTRTYQDLLNQFEIDMVLAEYGPTAVTVRKACERAGIPLVVHFHGYDAYRKAEVNRYRSEYAHVFAQAAAIIGVSRRMCTQLQTLGAPVEKVFLNPCGVDTDAFKPNPAQQRTPLHFLSVGRFVEKKAPHITLLAFAKVHKDYPEATLTMVGDGHLKASCIDLAIALGIAESVEFTGSKPHDFVQEMMHRVIALVQHSITGSNGDSEGAPVTLMEAGASGLPVVSTYHAGIPDIVKHQETGLLSEERQIDQMAANMCSIIANPDQALSMGARARKRIENHFSMSHSIDRLHEILVWARGNSSSKPLRIPEWINENHQGPAHLPPLTAVRKEY